MFGYHPATVRLAGGWAHKRDARFVRALRLWQSSRQCDAVRWRVELHRCCARVSRAAALVQQHIDSVARASSAGTKSRSNARSLVLLTVLAPLSRTARLEDQLDILPTRCACGGHFAGTNPVVVCPG